ncbi:gamma-F420-2:alpha-L-glutamate ligase [Povalibacter uvarum]|uniref:Gamma-F420-2:alpha-L-glutamate ligase n=1 Tax=Povalibacter uvarum TaxID=732238 RepID=A0A841HII9_9GAMM|nr:RimK family alpha-L-glutamate ligase [Povalibacter uvarum]MBB6092827.1 gamma-F420-2:alpha-L-glutamate ligase [Povalibacter uvarum]
MRCWLLFHRELAPDVPEAAEVMRFQQVAARLGIDLKVLQPRDFELIVDSADNWSAIYQGKSLPKPDLIIARTGSETSYFTLAVLRHFERQGVAMVNGPTAIESVADKLQTLQILSSAGLPIPKTILGKFPVDVGVVERELGFPVVVKTLKGTRGNGVLLCKDREQFGDLANLLDGASPGADFIFQQYIKSSHGRDVRVLVVNGKAVAAMERRSADGSFKSNISLGGIGTCFDPPPEMAELAVRVTRALGLDVAGIDILFDTHGYRICEANSSPGFQGLEKACGISVPDAIFAGMRERLGLPSRPRGSSWRRFISSLRRSLGDTQHQADSANP